MDQYRLLGTALHRTTERGADIYREPRDERPRRVRTRRFRAHRA